MLMNIKVTRILTHKLSNIKINHFKVYTLPKLVNSSYSCVH